MSMEHAERMDVTGTRWRGVAALFFSVVLTLSLFGGAASVVMAALVWKGIAEGGIGAMLLRVGLFCLMGLAGVGGVIWVRRWKGAGNDYDYEHENKGRVVRTKGWRGFLSFILHPSSFILLTLFALVVLPRLSLFPWMAPDEAYHLGVARNLASFGVYGSGSPEAGFVWFDNYASVGAPVIVPVAGAMWLAGADPVTPDTVGAGRLVMGLYFGVLCVAMYLLAMPRAGRSGALCGVVTMLAIPGSVYLSRTLYGEGPALAWLVLGLLAWRRSGFAAGVCFGLAVLCKSIVVLSAFAFVGVLCFEAASGRRIRWRDWLSPALGGVAVVATWWGIQLLHRHDVGGAAGGTLAEYQHNLLFGVRCLARTAPALMEHWLAWLAALGGLAAAGFGLSTRRYGADGKGGYDRSLMVLFMIAVFYLFWWLFFTPGHLPRYVWVSEAVGGMFAGAGIWRIYRALGGTRVVQRIVLATFVVSVGGVLMLRAERIWTLDEMRGDYEVASAIRDLPQSALIRTSNKSLAWTLNLLTLRRVEVVDRVGPQGAADAWTIVKEERGFRLLPPLKNR